MNVEEVMKKLEEIKVELYNNVTSSEDKSPIQVETQDRLPIDEDLAGEEIKIERTKGEKVKDRGNMSRSSPQDGSKNPDKDYVFGKNAPSIGELQNQLDGLFKEESNLSEETKEILEQLHAQIFNAIKEIPTDLMRAILSPKHDEDIPNHIHDMAEVAVNSIKEYYKT